MRQRLPRMLCAVTTVATLIAAFGPISGAGAATPATTPTPGVIRHVIVVMQSGHSFDNYFGTRPKVDGIPAKVCQPVTPKSVSCKGPYHLSLDQARAGLSDTLRVTSRAVDGGRMDGFVSAQPNAGVGSVAMGYFNGGDLPYYSSLASKFTLFDHFYAQTQAGSLPNRLVSVAATSDGITSNATPTFGINGVTTIFDRLDQAHVSWKYYVQGYQSSQKPTAGDVSRTPLLVMPSVVGTPARAARIVNTSQYYVDLAKGQLPAVSYVSSSNDSERSPQNPVHGEAFVRSLINSLMQSSAWSHTALLLTYDDSGGWYDHVNPPTVAGAQLGLRVPTLLVSPYARAGYVDHVQLDTASIPAMIESIFHLPPLGLLDANSGSILTGANLRQHPISPGVSSGFPVAAVPRPAVHTVYLLYLAAFLGAALLIALAFIRHRRDPFPAPPAQSTPAPPT